MIIDTTQYRLKYRHSSIIFMYGLATLEQYTFNSIVKWHAYCKNYNKYAFSHLLHLPVYHILVVVSLFMSLIGNITWAASVNIIKLIWCSYSICITSQNKAAKLKLEKFQRVNSKVQHSLCYFFLWSSLNKNRAS